MTSLDWVYKNKRSLILVMIMASVLIYFGYKNLSNYSNYSRPSTGDWFTGNIIFFSIFGFIIFWGFNSFNRQKDSQMRQNWTETKWYQDQYRCPECGSEDVKFDVQDARNRMLFIKCKACGYEWLFTVP